jgi:HlyD family secretion protein
MIRLIVVLAALLVLAGGGWVYLQAGSSKPADLYRYGDVVKGDVASIITATGTLVPEETVDVGAQVTGQIAEFGKDVAGKSIDYRSTVTQGMMLAKIDDSLYQADLSSAEASVAQADASKKYAEANLQQAQAKLEQTDRDYKRSAVLIKSHAIAQADYDTALGNYQQAVAAVAVAEASVTQSASAIDIAKAAVFRAKRNVDYCVITSPVNGVVIDRKMDVGQTVVASMSAQSLFLVAKDLKRMLLLVQVNEADIGAVQRIKDVSFTVDAFPGRVFHGTVRKIRLNASMTQNVVTYTVEISADNDDLTLLPYLTATVRFTTAKREGVLTVPNSALRFTPTSAPLESASEAAGGGEKGGGTTRPTGERRMGRGTLWVSDADGKPVAVKVRTGVTDGTVTEVEGDGVDESTKVITAENTGAMGDVNPFTPKFGQRRGK